MILCYNARVKRFFDLCNNTVWNAPVHKGYFVYGIFYFNENKKDFMKNKTILKDFLHYVFLNIAGQMAYSCYTLADTFFVSSKLGANGLTALNLAFPVFCLISGTGLMIGMGGGTNYSISKSRRKSKKANQVFSNAVYLTAFFSVLFFLTGIFFSEKIVKLLGADNTVFSVTNTYLKVMLLFAPAFLTNNLLQCFVRNDGAPSLSMAAMVTGSLSNVVLDYIFIFPLDMGILGAILATGLAPVISILILSTYFIRKKNAFHFRKIPLFEPELTEILSSGVPPFVTEAASGIVMFVFNFIILRLEGNVGVAAFSIITVISLVVVAIYTGLSQGIQPIISLNYGSGHLSAVKTILNYAMTTAFLISGVIYAAIFFNAPWLVCIFNAERNDVLQGFAVTGLKMYFLACPFIGFNIVAATYFISTERPRPAQIISLLRGFFILVPMAFLLSAIWKMTGVWCAYPLTECMVALIGTGFFFMTKIRQLQSPSRCMHVSKPRPRPLYPQIHALSFGLLCPQIHAPASGHQRCRNCNAQETRGDRQPVGTRHIVQTTEDSIKRRSQKSSCHGNIGIYFSVNLSCPEPAAENRHHHRRKRQSNPIEKGSGHRLGAASRKQQQMAKSGYGAGKEEDLNHAETVAGPA